MKNFPIEYEGNTYWRSRSVAVVGFVFCKNEDGEWCVLLEQRGTGAPNENGKWCVITGYLDYNEDGKMGVSRECKEETGVDLRSEQFTFDSVCFETTGEQNVCLRYTCILGGSKCTNDYPLTDQYNEEGETSDIKWVPISLLSSYVFAFDHEAMIPFISKKLGLL